MPGFEAAKVRNTPLSSPLYFGFYSISQHESVGLLAMAAKQSIAFVANTSWSIYKFRLYLIEQLIGKGYAIYVLAPRDAHTALFESLPGLTYIELDHLKSNSISPFQDALLYWELRSHYRRLRPGLIFHYTIKANIWGTLAAASAGIPSISVVTGLGYTFSGKGWLLKAVKKLYRLALRSSAETWFLNEDDRLVFTAEKLIDPQKTFLLPGEGVDVEGFFPSPYVTGKKTVTFLLVGRMISHKGIYEFIRAAGLLRQKGLAITCQLLGFFDDNNPVAIPRSRVEEWTKSGIVTYLGHTDQVAPFIEQADCIVLPSYREGLPLSLLEGASMCKALIAANTAGCRDLIEEGRNGYLCPEKDEVGLAEKMAVYYHLPAEAKRQMGIESRNKILQNFTREIVAGIYLDKIHSFLIAGRE
jgi:glycosyltransferase involved in cell wall biosynthesis